VVELVTFPLNVLIKEIKTMMMKTTARKTEAFRNMRKETMEGRPRGKISTQGRTTTHLMMNLIMIIIQKRCSSWLWTQKKPLMIIMSLKRKEK